MRTQNKKLNVKLLRRIQKHIIEEPRRFFMEGFVVKAKSESEWKSKSLWYNDISTQMPPCKTAACIAGTANLITGGRNLAASTRAAKLLGVPTFRESRWKPHFLFQIDGWPEPFQSRYMNAKTSKTRAKIACARIDYLIKTGK
jgi:hypothetical protein